MYTDIRSVLGNRYAMFFHPAFSIDDVRPVCDLDQCLAQVNDRLKTQGRNIRQWSPGDQDQAARLLWVNWIYQHLSQEPIRKPILVHRENNVLVVDCGDTRLMALGLCDVKPTVQVIATDLLTNSDLYEGWRPVHNNQDLIALCGFGENATISFTAIDSYYAISWLEIGDHSTAHHLHRIDQRISMINQYVSQQPEDFFFDKRWARASIDWKSYDLS